MKCVCNPDMIESWTYKNATCRHCNASYDLDHTDIKNIIIRTHNNLIEDNEYFIKCPYCNHTIYLRSNDIFNVVIDEIIKLNNHGCDY